MLKNGESKRGKKRKLIMKILNLLLSVLVLSSATCTQNQHPFHSTVECTVIKDVNYSNGIQYCGNFIQSQQNFDIYVPDVSPYGNLKPIIIYIHGGGFSSNDKDDILPYVKKNVHKILNSGIAFATINYRLLDLSNNCQSETCGVRDKCLDDIARCIKYIKANASIYGIDKNRIGLIGTSAGGTSAQWIGFGGFEHLYGINNNHYNIQYLDNESTQVKAIYCDKSQYSLDIQSWSAVFTGQCSTPVLNLVTIRNVLTSDKPCYLHAMYGVGDQSGISLNQIQGLNSYLTSIDLPSLMTTIQWTKPRIFFRNTNSMTLNMQASSINHHPLHANKLKNQAVANTYDTQWYIPNFCNAPTSSPQIDWWDFFMSEL